MEIFYVLSPCTVYIKLSNFIRFSLENDDMESSKRCVKLFSLVFIIRCLSKSNFIRIIILTTFYGYNLFLFKIIHFLLILFIYLLFIYSFI